MSSHRHHYGPFVNSNTNNNVKKSSSSTSSSTKTTSKYGLPLLPNKFPDKSSKPGPLGPPPAPTWDPRDRAALYSNVKHIVRPGATSPSTQRHSHSQLKPGATSPSTQRHSHSQLRPGATSPSTQRHSHSNERQPSPSTQRHFSSHSNERPPKPASPSTQRHSYSNERPPRPASPSTQRRVHRSSMTGTSAQSFPQEHYFATLMAAQAKQDTVPRPPDTTPTHRHDHYTSLSRTSTGMTHGTARSVSPSATRNPGHHHHSPSSGELPEYRYPSHLDSPWSGNAGARRTADSNPSSKPRERHLDRKRDESLSRTSRHRRSGSFHHSSSTSSEGSIRRSGSLSNVSESRQAVGTTPSYTVEWHTGEQLGSKYMSENSGSKKSLTATLDSRVSGHHSSTYSAGSAARDRSVARASSPDPLASRSRRQTLQFEDASLKLGAGASSSQRKEESVARPSWKAVKTGSQQSLDSIMSAYSSGGIVGLCNLGNTCFMNSIIQCLSHTIELTDLFLCNNYTSKMCSAYRKAMRDIWLHQENSNYPSVLASSLQHKSRRPLNMIHLKNAISTQRYEYYGSSQHDAQEFMTCLVTTLHNELLKPAGKIPSVKSDKDLSDQELGQIRWEYQLSVDSSPISSIFMGQFKSVIKCQVCGCTSRVFEPFWDIGLPLCKTTPMDLKDCFMLFTKKETLDDDNKPICTDCRKPQKSYKQMTIQRFPHILILYLKRFFMGRGVRHKLQLPVTVPMSVDLSSFTSPETAGGKKVKYELYGIVNHTGSLDFGHYTADIKHFASQKWYHCNDSSVYRHPDSSSLATGRQFTSESVYVLFYRQELDSSP